MKYCFNCGREIGEDFEFCPECGVSQSQSGPSSTGFTRSKYCKNCGSEMPEDALYCLNCGYDFGTGQEDIYHISNKIQRMTGVWKNKWVALALCIFLGWLGIHRYYEGKIVTGLLYTFTFGLFGIGWFIDIILLILKPNPYRVK